VKQYSAERKEALLRQMMPPQNRLVSELARESGITEQTLYTWRRQLRNQGTPVPGSGKNAEEWTSEDKFAVVLETAALNASELSEYCRRKGLFAEQIATWRAACMAANATQQTRGQQAQSKEDKKRIRQLEKDLQRKEKALAEAAALLILRKKAQAIWGDKEED
jgi:transposase-like protein